MLTTSRRDSVQESQQTTEMKGNTIVGAGVKDRQREEREEIM